MMNDRLLATLLDQDGHVLSTGEATISVQHANVYFYPHKQPVLQKDADRILPHAAILKSGVDEKIYQISNGRVCKAPNHAAHFEFDLEPYV